MYKIRTTMNISKISLATVLLFITTTLVYSQNERGIISKRIQARKIAFITERLDLSPSEAEQFFPLYNAFKKNEQALRKNRIGGNKITFLSDEEAEKHIDEILQSEEEILRQRKLFVQSLQPILSPKKILMLFRVEKDFNAQLLRTMRQRHRRD